MYYILNPPWIHGFAGLSASRHTGLNPQGNHHNFEILTEASIPEYYNKYVPANPEHFDTAEVFSSLINPKCL